MTMRAHHLTRMPGLRFELWPSNDRHLWEMAFHDGDYIEDVGAGVKWRPHTRVQVAKAWGVFLAFLAGHDALDDAAKPAERMTPDRLRRFIKAQQEIGNRNTSIAERVFELKMALNVMHPDLANSFAWVTAPGGRSITQWLPGKPAPKMPFHSTVLADWGFDIIQSAEEQDDPINRARAVRDGLIILVLAARAPRVRSLMAMRIGVHLRRGNGEFLANFENDDMKEANTLAYGLN